MESNDRHGERILRIEETLTGVEEKWLDWGGWLVYEILEQSNLGLAMLSLDRDQRDFAM